MVRSISNTNVCVASVTVDLSDCDGGITVVAVVVCALGVALILFTPARKTGRTGIDKGEVDGDGEIRRFVIGGNGLDPDPDPGSDGVSRFGFIVCFFFLVSIKSSEFCTGPGAGFGFSMGHGEN